MWGGKEGVEFHRSVYLCMVKSARTCYMYLKLRSLIINSFVCLLIFIHIFINLYGILEKEKKNIKIY